MDHPSIILQDQECLPVASRQRPVVRLPAQRTAIRHLHARRLPVLTRHRRVRRLPVAVRTVRALPVAEVAPVAEVVPVVAVAVPAVVADKEIRLKK